MLAASTGENDTNAVAAIASHQRRQVSGTHRNGQ
jgi:hypothetical protein